MAVREAAGLVLPPGSCWARRLHSHLHLHLLRTHPLLHAAVATTRSHDPRPSPGRLGRRIPRVLRGGCRFGVAGGGLGGWLKRRLESPLAARGPTVGCQLDPRCSCLGPAQLVAWLLNGWLHPQLAHPPAPPPTPPQIWSRIALDPSLPAAERSAVPFVLLLQHMSPDFRQRFRDHIMRIVSSAACPTRSRSSAAALRSGCLV